MSPLNLDRERRLARLVSEAGLPLGLTLGMVLRPRVGVRQFLLFRNASEWGKVVCRLNGGPFFVLREGRESRYGDDLPALLGRLVLEDVASTPEKQPEPDSAEKKEPQLSEDEREWRRKSERAMAADVIHEEAVRRAEAAGWAGPLLTDKILAKFYPEVVAEWRKYLSFNTQEAP